MSGAVWQIADLLPQAAPMVLLDEVLDHDAAGLRAIVRVRSDTRFYHPGLGVPAHVGLEWMAQACGAFAGLRACMAGEPVKLGFLLGTRRFTASVSWFTAGECLTVRVIRVYEEDGMGAFDCRIEADGAERATARLTLYQPEDPSRVLSRALP